ncbi:MAG: MbnP family protein [Bacteroidota bacterium]
MRIIKSALAFILIGLIIFSCGDDDPRDVNFKLQMNVGSEPLMHESTYMLGNIPVQFTNVAFYLGDMKISTSDGIDYEAATRYHLIKPGIYEFNFSVSADDASDDLRLSGISFFVGVDPETNSQSTTDFTERSADDPLSQQNPSMDWGWNTGYRFLNIDGNADLDGDGEFETQLTYHLGRDEYLANININSNALIEEGSNEYQIVFDLERLLSNLDFSTENFTKVQPDNKDVADKILANYSASFNIVE